MVSVLACLCPLGMCADCQESHAMRDHQQCLHPGTQNSGLSVEERTQFSLEVASFRKWSWQDHHPACCIERVKRACCNSAQGRYSACSRISSAISMLGPLERWFSPTVTSFWQSWCSSLQGEGGQEHSSMMERSSSSSSSRESLSQDMTVQVHSIWGFSWSPARQRNWKARCVKMCPCTAVCKSAA